MNYKSQMLCAWMGLLAALLIGIGVWPLMHFLPPLSPALSADQLADIYRSNQTGVLVGGIVMMLGVTVCFPFFCSIAMQLARMEYPSRLWTWTFLFSGTLGIFPTIIGELCFSIAAYRPEHSPEIMQAFSDLGFMMLIGAVFPGVLQFLSAGFAILGDRNAKPVFPRWTGYFSIWMGILVIPGAFVPLFKSGPFAWNGVLAFWVAASAFFNWMLVILWAQRRAILAQMHSDKTEV